MLIVLASLCLNKSTCQLILCKADSKINKVWARQSDQTIHCINQRHFKFITSKYKKLGKTGKDRLTQMSFGMWDSSKVQGKEIIEILCVVLE